MARLVVNPGTPQAWEIALKPGANSIGRGDHNDFKIPDGSVSSSHCHVFVEDGAVRIKDLGSTNGTRIEQSPVTETILQHGQRIHLGSVELLLEMDAPQPQQQAQVVQLSPIAEGSVTTLVTPQPITATPPAPRLQISKPAAATSGAQAASRLQISKPAAVTAEEIVPETTAFEPPPIATAMLLKSAVCKYHPKSPARWMCTKCHKTFCDLCVSTRASATGNVHICRSCGGACTPLHVTIELPKERSFWKEIPRSFVYPFRGSGVLVLVVSTILFAALDFMARGILSILMKIVVLGYLYSYVQNIIHSTAAEEDEMPQLPDMDDVFGGFFRLVGTALVCFGPALVLAYFAIWQEQPMAAIAMIPAIILGCFYFPMAFLAVAMKDSVFAANPLVVIPSIARVPLEYFVTAILLAGVFGMRWLGDVIVAILATRTFMTRSIAELLMIFGLRMVWAFISLYLLTVNMRILGILYLTKKHKLGWFNH